MQTKQSAEQNQETLIIEEKFQGPNGETMIKKYEQSQFLGKGGFAKCYQITNLESKKIMAAKIIPKNTLVKNRARQKLISEIKIHKSLSHTNIVKFEHVFEDNTNIYILLELCPHQTLNELIKRRKKLSEIEVQCYLLQIASSLKYLYSNLVIHRDLKLGNLFIGEGMEIKLGDFGLAAKLEFQQEKRRTICGTPNYIAPEILDGKVGHSFEVDVWSLGVIIYTLLIGKPPFETSDVKTTYKKIKQNQYSFPENIQIPSSAKNLIQQILVQEPEKRPSLDEILAHPFISNIAQIPKLLPVTTLQTPPDSQFMKQYQQNSKQLQQNVSSVSQEQFNQKILQKDSQFPKSQTVSNLQQKPFIQSIGTFNNHPPDKREFQQSNQYLSGVNLNQKEQQNEYFKAQTIYNDKNENILDKNNPGQPLQLEQIDGKRGYIWVTQYVDYSSKYGLGYLLNSGSAGVSFNDNTKIALDAKGKYLEYIIKDKTQETMMQYEVTKYPEELKKKVTLLNHFHSYLIVESQKKNIENKFKFSENTQQTSPLVYLKKWMKTKHAILFRLSNKIVQVQFLDKTEIILNSNDKLVIYFNKKREPTYYPLAEAMNSPNNEMTKRLKYTKEILTQLLKNNKLYLVRQYDDPQHIENPMELNLERQPSSNKQLDI